MHIPEAMITGAICPVTSIPATGLADTLFCLMLGMVMVKGLQKFSISRRTRS